MLFFFVLVKTNTKLKWFTAFPQIVSRVGHSNPEVYKYLSQLIITVMEAYPKQALWLFMSVVKSTKENRQSRGRQILSQLGVCLSPFLLSRYLIYCQLLFHQSNPHTNRNHVSKLITTCLTMTNELLALCDHPVDDNKSTLSMSKDFPRLNRLGCSELIIPLQESLTVTLPPPSSVESTHQPFPLNTPTFKGFLIRIIVTAANSF